MSSKDEELIISIVELQAKISQVKSAFEELFGFVQGLMISEKDPNKLEVYKKVLNSAKKSHNGE